MKNRKPNYILAKDLILKTILTEAYQIGDALPPIQKLSSLFGIGKISIHQAIGILEEEGYLKNVRGSGCYIKKLPPASAMVGQGEEAEPGVDPSKWYTKSLTTIRVGISSELPELEDMWKKIFVGYQKINPTINVEMVSINWRDLSKKQYMADIQHIPTSYLPYYAAEELIFDPSLIEDFDLSANDFPQNMADTCRYEGKTWGVPTFLSTNIVYYNKKFESVLKPFNEEPDFWKSLKALKKIASSTPYKGFSSLVLNNHPLHSFMTQLGFEVKDGPGTFNTPGLEDFLDEFLEYYGDEKLFYPNLNFSLKRGFSNQAGLAVLGHTSWHLDLLKLCPFQIGTAIDKVDAKGSLSVAGMLMAISNYTYHPEECLEIIKYLASMEVQKILASNGRIVGHQAASQHLKIKGLEKKSIGVINDALFKSRPKNSRDLNAENFHFRVGQREMALWQKRIISTKEFLERLSSKMKFYYRAHDLRRDKGID